MKVHVVTQEWSGDNILSRLARTLIDHTGWTVGDHPDLKADLNYFFPYLFWEDFKDWRSTLIAGWFTHRDEHFGEEKTAIWDRAVTAMNVRTTSAKRNIPFLLSGGPTEYVTPPLDRRHFTIPPLRSRRMDFHVGVAGMVYSGGRKGEHLLLQATLDPRFQHVQWKAAGRGWPIPCTYYSWEGLPAFYGDLDVFLCTSLNEGPGYPPLEALACGVQVVIPKDVGMFDELPDAPGIWRYPAGDYEGMAFALEQALAHHAHPEHLRAVTEPYTANAWANDHFHAFERFITKPLPVDTDLLDWEGRSGIYYVAYGKPARECAVEAMASARRYLPDIPVAIVSSETVGVEDFPISQPDRDVGARWNKTLIYDLSPSEWNYVLYLDADTEIISGDVKFLFQALQDGWEFVICKNPERYASTRYMHRPDNLDEIEMTFTLTGCDHLIQWNGGVFGFRRNERVERFFKLWHEEWQLYGKRDQAALIRAMWKQPLRVLTLGNEWNCVVRYDPPERSAGILHYPTTARRVSGIVQGRLDSEEAWNKVKPEER